MNKFLITKVFSDSGFIRPDTLVYDEVELRPAKFDLSEERDAITKSVKNFSASVNVDVNTRITTIVTASSEDDALLLADNNFIEIIDVLSVNFPISLVELSECGFVKNLSDGEIKPLNKKQSYLSNSFLVRKTKFPSFDNEQWLIQQTTELSIRYRRSLHWSRKSKIETNIQR